LIDARSVPDRCQVGARPNDLAILLMISCVVAGVEHQAAWKARREPTTGRWRIVTTGTARFL